MPALALTVIVALGCSESSTVADDQVRSSSKTPEASTSITKTTLPGDPSSDVGPPSDASDEEPAEALADILTFDAIGLGTNECTARMIVERIGGNELRPLGWTPATIRSPGFSPFIELEPDQFHLLAGAQADCSDPVDLALQYVAVGPDQIDPNCLVSALGPEPQQTVLRSIPTDPDYNAGFGLGNALLDCLDPVELVATL